MIASSTAQIVTLTLNPAIDQTVRLTRLLPGTVMRAQAGYCYAGGKGVNVASCLASGGFSVMATGILGLQNSSVFQTFFSEHGIEDSFIYIEGVTRTNIKLVTSEETTDINLPGMTVTEDVLDKVRKLLLYLNPDFLVLAGSLPPGCPDDFYVSLIAEHQNNKTGIIADCSGEALKVLIASKLRPFCIKPNRAELSECVGKPLETVESVVVEAKKLHSDGIALVVVSMGHEGAVFVSREGAVHASIKLDCTGSAVGAGDAMVAGITSALIHGFSLEKIAENATSWAAGKLEYQGSGLPSSRRIAELGARVQCKFLD